MASDPSAFHFSITLRCAQNNEFPIENLLKLDGSALITKIRSRLLLVRRPADDEHIRGGQSAGDADDRQRLLAAAVAGPLL